MIFAISQYKNIQATKKDVLDALDQYRALTHRVDSYVFNDGTKKELLNLNGTIPMIYKSEFIIVVITFEHLMIHRFRKHLSHPGLHLADGHSSVQRANLLCEADT